MFKTLDQCDQDDPREAHQWVFSAGLPFHGSTPLIIHEEVWPEWSELFSDYGLVHAPSLARLADEDGNIHVSKLPVQSKFPHAPRKGPEHYLNPAAHVSDNDDEPGPVPLPDPLSFTREQQEAMVERLRYAGVLPEDTPPVDTAMVEKTFNPSDHTPPVVVGYLLGQPDHERRRVLSAEMRGKKRAKILNHPEWKGM